MGRLSSLLDKMKDKRNELVRRAASKAADVALDKTKSAARGALDTVSDTLEKAIFGDVLGEADERKRPGGVPSAPDPFAKLKARERARAEEAAREPTPEANDDVDAELAALKKRLGK